jgi:hypothetical protein
MSSPLQVQANRINALKSTGPRTGRGKQVSSRNALRHGVKSWKPVLLPWESGTAWEKFAAAMLQDLAPRGPMEMAWAGRIALIIWRLQRSALGRKTLADQQWREAQVQAPQSAWWTHRHEFDKSLPGTLEGLRKEMSSSRRQRALLDRVIAADVKPETTAIARRSPEGPEKRDKPPRDLVDSKTAVELIEWAAGHIGYGNELSDDIARKKVYPGIGSLAKEPDMELYYWTVGMVREGLTEVAGWQDLSFADLMASLAPAMKQAYNQMRATERRADREMRSFRQCSAAKSPETFQKFDQYEAALERSLALAQSQLRMLQSARGIKTSVNVEKTSADVVQMGFVSVETLEKQS